jgi:hypothetical protein
MQIPESRPDLDCRSVTVDALSRQYGQSMSLMLRAFSRENEFICSGVHRPDRTLSMSLRCPSRLKAQSLASYTSSMSSTRRSFCWHACEEIAFSADMTDLSAHGATTIGRLQAGVRRTLIQVGGCSHRAASVRSGQVQSSVRAMTADLSADERGTGS